VPLATHGNQLRMSQTSCTLRTRKFMTNRLLARRQFVSARHLPNTQTLREFVISRLCDPPETRGRGRRRDVLTAVLGTDDALLSLCRSWMCSTPAARTCPR